jgi:hypothetical protein
MPLHSRDSFIEFHQFLSLGPSEMNTSTKLTGRISKRSSFTSQGGSYCESEGYYVFQRGACMKQWRKIISLT